MQVRELASFAINREKNGLKHIEIVVQKRTFHQPSFTGINKNHIQLLWLLFYYTEYCVPLYRRRSSRSKSTIERLRALPTWLTGFKEIVIIDLTDCIISRVEISHDDIWKTDTMIFSYNLKYSTFGRLSVENSLAAVGDM